MSSIENNSVKEISLSSREEIAKLVTRIWEHPLLDKGTIAHRSLAKKKLSLILDSMGINPQSYFTVPVGSLIWAVNRQSDFDYQLVFGTQEEYEAARGIIDANERKFNFKLRLGKVHLMNNMSSDKYIKFGQCHGLLFTPDEYIGGNIELAKATRIKAVAQTTTGGIYPNVWEENIRPNFATFFTQWDDTSRELARFGRSISKKDRTKRITDRLRLRAHQSSNPDLYIKKFYQARKNIIVPDIETYAAAIRQTKGALEINKKYIAEGIVTAGKNERFPFFKKLFKGLKW